MSSKPKAVAASPITSPAVPRSTKSAATVSVACKIPTGVVLQLCRKTTYMEDTPTGPRERHRFDRTGQKVILRGPGYPNGQAPKGFPERPQVTGGYALTTIDREFWESWLEQNDKNAIVVGQMVFAHTTRDDTKAEAQELRGTKSGLEPLDVDGGDSRMPRPTAAGVGKLETADRVA